MHIYYGSRSLLLGDMEFFGTHQNENQIYGTELKTDFQLTETSLSTTTLCLLSVSHCSIQLLYCFPYHVILARVLVFDVELYQMLSGNPNR